MYVQLFGCVCVFQLINVFVIVYVCKHVLCLVCIYINILYCFCMIIGLMFLSFCVVHVRVNASVCVKTCTSVDAHVPI